MSLTLLGVSRRGVAATPVTSLTFIGSTSETGVSDGIIALHADAAAGDLAIFFNEVGAPSGTPSDYTPTDWVSGPNYAQTGLRAKIMAGLVTSAEATAEEIQGMTSGGQQHGAIVVFRPNNPITSLSFESVSTEGFTSGDPASQALSATGGAAPLVICAWYRSSGTINPRTWTGSTPTEIEVTASNRYAKYHAFDSSPSDVTIDMDDEGNNNGLLGCWLEVA